MSARVRHITIDCADPYALATFWSQVLDAAMDDEDEPGDPDALLDHGNGPPSSVCR